MRRAEHPHFAAEIAGILGCRSGALGTDASTKGVISSRILDPPLCMPTDNAQARVIR